MVRNNMKKNVCHISLHHQKPKNSAYKMLNVVQQSVRICTVISDRIDVILRFLLNVQALTVMQ
jgi:hypothetical protein